MGLLAQPVVQLANFSETFIFDTLEPGETGSAVLSGVAVVTSPSFDSDGSVSLPANVAVSDTTTETEIKATISGDYGIGIALEDLYRTVTFTNFVSTVTEYENYDDLDNAEYSHLTNYLPQDWSYKTYTFTFTVTKTPGGVTTRTVTQEVYPNMDRHVPRVASLVAKEVIA